MRTQIFHTPNDSWLDAPDPEATGKNFKYLRETHGFTQEGLSEVMENMGCPASVVTISNWENGHRLPRTLETWFVLARLYGCRLIDDLIITYRQTNGAA